MRVHARLGAGKTGKPRAWTRPPVELAQALVPALAAACYPLWLRAAHALPGPTGLLAALAMPLAAAAMWIRAASQPPRSVLQLRARRLALLAVAAPPLFVLMAFVLGLLGQPLPELVAWAGLWSVAGLWAAAGSVTAPPDAALPPDATARVVHGLVAALLLAFVGFHLFNHLAGLLGPQAHAAVMRAGRAVYRLPAVEAMLVVLLMLQLSLGAWLAWRWSISTMDSYRAVQVATGVYLGFFALTHMNSALVSARLLHGWETDWAWATGAPPGLLSDAWGVRLWPHYTLGAFGALAHLVCGLRAVLLAHGRRAGVVNLAWRWGLAQSATAAGLISLGLGGLQIIH